MLSYSRGPDQPLWEKTIGQVLDQTVDRWGDCLALVSRHQSKRYTWRELRHLADCVARGLHALGIGPGDRVGLWSTNCVEWILVELGCARAGATLVNVNPAYRTHDLAFALRKSRMKVLFLWEHDGRADYVQILEDARRGQALPLKHVVLFGTTAWEEFLRAPFNVDVASNPKTLPISSTRPVPRVSPRG
jgi:fatty-acyl-CoA synthase